MKDRYAVIWTQLAGHPIKMGTLVVTDKEARFTYESTYIDTGLRGLGLVYIPQAFRNTIVRKRNEYFNLHPPVQALIPPHAEDNLLRTLVVKYLNRIHIEMESGFDTDWEILMHSGHGAIGHLDVFASDTIAERWYVTPQKKDLVELDDKFGFSLKNYLLWYDGDAEPIIDILGPTPTVGGAIPKLPLSINKAGWDGRIGLPRRFGDTDRIDILLKLENTNRYPGIIELEQLGLSVHQDAGFEVPRHWPVKIKGLHALAIERFDRSAEGLPVFMESVHSLLASGIKDVTTHYSRPYDDIVKAIDSVKLPFIKNRVTAKKHLLERLILAMLTGNGDLHLQNLSFIEREGEIIFSPVYDPVPMRAYSIHNTLVPQGMSFGDYGDIIDNKTIGFSEAMLRFTKAMGFNKNGLIDSIARLLQVTRNYHQRVQSLATLPDDYKNNLIAVTNRVRQQFQDF